MQADTMNLFPPSHDTVNLTTLTIEPLDWVYHEKLCVVDNQTAFIGGVDICFGRWDTNDYPIALVIATVESTRLSHGGVLVMSTPPTLTTSCFRDR